MDSDADRIIDLYERHANTYARDRGTEIREQRHWLEHFLKLIPPCGFVLDLGCGSGQPVGRYLIENGYSVTGVDSSSTLIGKCISNFPKQQWIVADMRVLSLDGTFDGILAWDSFFHLCPDDQRRMFPIFRKHASPQAALMFTSGPSYGEAIGSYCGEPLYHASLDREEYRSLLEENGFGVVSHVVEDPTCGTHTIWLALAREPQARANELTSVL
jgi:SAM-dependent methyltransferase